MPRVESVDGVLLGADEARFLVGALDTFGQVLAERGSRPSPKLVDLQRRLSRAVTDVTRRKADVGVSSAVPQPDWDASSAHEFLDSERAAAILGCTPGNVRDLARRGSLPAIHTTGRWLYPAAAVVERAERRRD